MLVAGRQWLPQYSEEIPKAEKRLADSRLPLHPAKGFRLHEMAEEKAKYRALASAAAKENVK